MSFQRFSAVEYIESENFKRIIFLAFALEFYIITEQNFIFYAKLHYY